MEAVWNAMQIAIKEFLDIYLIANSSRQRTASILAKQSSVNDEQKNEHKSSPKRKKKNKNLSPSVSFNSERHTPTFATLLKNSSVLKNVMAGNININTSIIQSEDEDGHTRSDITRISSAMHSSMMDKMSFTFAGSNDPSIVRYAAGMNRTRQHKPPSSITNFSSSKLKVHSTSMHTTSSRTALGLLSSLHSGGSTGGAYGRRRKSSSPDIHHKIASSSSSNATINSDTADVAIESSPYHITKLYRAVIRFIENAETVVHKNKKNTEIKYDINLREFLHTFVHKSFIPHMQAEANAQLAKILLSEQSFDEHRISGESLLLLRSTTDIFQLIKNLFEYYIMLPVFNIQQVSSMIRTILQCFSDFYKQLILEIAHLLISQQLTNDEQYMKQLSSFNLRTMFMNKNKNNLFNNNIIGTHDETKYDNSKAHVASFSVVKYNDVNSNGNDREFEYYNDLIANFKFEQYAKINKIDFVPGNSSSSTVYMQTFNTDYYSKLSMMSAGLMWISNKIKKELIFNKKHMHRTHRSKNNSFKQLFILSILFLIFVLFLFAVS